MSKGDWIEPLATGAVQLVGRVLFPRTGGYSDEISWPWLCGIVLALVAAAASNVARKAEIAGEADEAGSRRKWHFTVAFWFAWAGFAWSLFFFRFGRIV